VDEPGREALGRRGVSRRELEVLAAVAERLTNAEIAGQLCVSERTVESHVSSLLHKLGAANRTELRRWAGQRTRESDNQLPHQLDAIARGGPCVGRDEGLQRLLACWDRAAAGTTVAVVRGEAGMGKSRLTAEVAIEVHRRGGRVWLGTCVDGSQRPYEPFMVPIEDELARLSDDELRRELGAWGVTFARLSSDMAMRLGVVGPDVVDPERERVAVQAALHEHLMRRARAKPLLFVIEDLHWASAGTRDSVAHIARAGGDAPLMLLVTTRDERPFVDGGFGAYLGRLTALPSVEVVALSGLDSAAAADVIADVGGDLDPEQGVRQTGGNPLYLRELAREGTRSRSLGELVADRFDRLDPGDLDILDLAAVAGEQIDVALVASALDRSADDVLDALERAEAAGLVGPGAHPGRFAFAHDVFRSGRYASLTASRRLRLHAAVATALGRRSADETVLAELARHACLAVPRFDPSTAADLARRAGDAASDATDHGAAAEHYRRALDALDLVSDVDEGARLEVSIRLGASLVLTGDAVGRAMLRAAARAARQRGDPVALARAVCAMAPVPGGSTTIVRADREFTSLAGAALGMLPPSEERWRIRVLALLGGHLLLTTEPGLGTEMIRAAVSAARRLDDPVTLGRALLSYRFCGGPLEMAPRMACGAELIEIGDRTGLEVFACVGRQQLFWCHRELGDLEEMDRWYRAAAEHVRGPDLDQLSQAPAVALMDGDLERAERLTDELIDAWDASAADAYTDPLRFAIEDVRGRTPDLDEMERQRASGTAFEDIMEALLGRAWARRGHPSKAQELLDRTRHRGWAPMYAARGGAIAVSCWAETAAIVEDRAAAEDLAGVLEPLAGRLVDCGAFVWDTVDRLRALLRLASGDPAEAAEIAAVAVAASRRRGTPIFLGRELIVLASAQRRLGVDDSEVGELVDEARAIARQTGARIITQDAQLFLEAGAVQPSDPFGLTPREREILDLVAGGATNAQIATALRLSPATVRKHLEHVYGKLGVATRTAAVARTRS
jgi:DNA-binding NarL/FixJ family response regulator